MPSPLHLLLPIASPPLALISCCSFFDLDLDRQPRLHRTVHLLLTSSTSTFASTSGFGVTGGFLVRQSAVQDVMTGINDESTTLSTK
ncbi:hypothetical protein MVLG_07324, partial [Microbotryum lychnidis-dioicae p1A1 Lamole]